MIIMSVDLGKVRTGTAICDKQGILASPLETIRETNRQKLLEKIALLAKERQAQLIVVGLPKNMDGTEGASAQNARAFSAELGEITGLKIALCDERGTSITAHGYLNETNTRGKKRKAVVDTVAAVIILEDYLRR